MQSDTIMTYVYTLNTRLILYVANRKFSFASTTAAYVEYVMGIRYTSGRRGNVWGRIFGPLRCCTTVRKASTVSNSAI